MLKHLRAAVVAGWAALRDVPPDPPARLPVPAGPPIEDAPDRVIDTLIEDVVHAAETVRRRHFSGHGGHDAVGRLRLAVDTLGTALRVRPRAVDGQLETLWLLTEPLLVNLCLERHGVFARLVSSRWVIHEDPLRADAFGVLSYARRCGLTTEPYTEPAHGGPQATP